MILGNHQQTGYDFEDVFSPMVSFTVIRAIVTYLVIILKWLVSQLDVNSAYLYVN